MTRKEAVFVGLLLAGSIAAVVFVFLMMTRPGGAFATETKTQAAQPVKRKRPVRKPPSVTETPPEVAPEPAPEPEPEPEPDLPAEEPVEEEPPGPDPSVVYGELTLELLAPAEEEDRAVRVRVMDREGVAMQGVLVVFREGETLLYRERTDAEGHASFQPYAEEKGPFRVDALEHGFVPATAAKVASGAEIELFMVMRPAISGIVKAPSRGHGLVRVFTETRDYQTKIKRDGTFLFEDLEPGPVTVQAVVPPYGGTEQSFNLREGTHERLLLRVRKKSTRTILGEIDGWTGAGKATINGVNVPVTLGGTFEFKQAVVGQNEIFIDAKDRALYRNRFSVVAGKTKYKFKVPRAAKIKGTVRDARTRRAIPNAQVRVGVNFDLPENREANPLFPIEDVPLVTTDRDGEYEITRLDGRLIYIVSVVAEGYGQFVGEAVPQNKTNVLMPEGPFLFGKLRGLGGVPRDAIVTARPLESDLGERITTPREAAEIPNLRFNIPAWNHGRSGRDVKGFYGLTGLVPGLYLIRVDAGGYGSLETVVDLRDGRRTRVDMRLRRGQFADDDEAELMQRLPPYIYTLDDEEVAPADTTVLRLDTRRPVDQMPLPGVKVLFFEDDQEFAAPMKFDEPQFELVGLPEATYRAILTHPSFKKPIVKEVVLRRGEPADVVLK